jgi:hypothetical protein
MIAECNIEEELVKKVGKGRVSYFRQKQNVGSLRNFETCINRSRGKYIHLLHGDDELKGILFCNKRVLKIPRSWCHIYFMGSYKSNGIVSRQSILEANEPCLLVVDWL